MPAAFPLAPAPGRRLSRQRGAARRGVYFSINPPPSQPVPFDSLGRNLQSTAAACGVVVVDVVLIYQPMRIWLRMTASRVAGLSLEDLEEEEDLA